MLYLIAGAVLGLGVFLFLFLAMCFRTVVSTNDVHIVQSAKKTVSYGKGMEAGNTYYAIPSWVPFYGIKVIKLPVSVFSIELESYAAYDKGRVPFIIDIMAFFRISDSNTAAQRVHSFEELTSQLKGILQGASRSILAKSEIETILEERAEYGIKFTDAVKGQLPEWGIENVKTIELMDIRDAQGSQVIQNIMAKKKSLVEKESRVEVAKNMQAAKEAEIVAEREIALRDQEAKEQVGKRTADKEMNVGIATQKAQQAVKEEEKATAEKAMAVIQVQQVRAADIQKEVKIVQAEQQKRTSVIDAEGHAAASVATAKGNAETMVANAEGQKKQTELVAQGNLTQAELHAKGVQAEGLAKGTADSAVNAATVAAQVQLAKEIGQNAGYQTYLISVRQVEASQAVGVAQAAALAAAHIKVIANSGSVIDGVDSLMGLLTPKGGTQIGATLEALAQTDLGAAVLGKLGIKSDEKKPTTPTTPTTPTSGNGAAPH